MNRSALQRIRQAGFSLVELMVAMVIGLLATLVIHQMFTVFAGQSRTTTSGADAQENGLISLYTIERDIRAAGYGLAASALQSCTTIHTYKNDPSSTAVPGPIPNFTLRGFAITDGGAGSDILFLQYGTSVRAGVDGEITKTMPQSSSELNISNTNGFADGDLMVASDTAGNCTLMQVTQVQPSAFKIQHNPGASSLTYNPPVSYQNSPPAPEAPWPPYASGSKLYNLGSMVSRRYSIGTNSLQVEDSGAAAVALVRDIVTIQAQYGITATSAPTDHTVTQWVDATGIWVTPSNNNFQRIKAIRVAVVARSNLRERSQVSPATIKLWPNATAGQTTTGPTYTVPDQNYRYKVYETVVPMRNVIWGNT